VTAVCRHCDLDIQEISSILGVAWEAIVGPHAGRCAVKGWGGHEPPEPS
jgi:hypothetical protein